MTPMPDAMKTVDLLLGLFAFGLLPAILLAAEIGRRLGRRYLARHPEGFPKGTGPVEGAAFALVGLVIGFAFSGANARFEARRHLVTAEANAISTVFLRFELLPAADRTALRRDLLQYLDVRIRTYRDLDDARAVADGQAQAAALRREVWNRTTAVVTRPGAPTPEATLLLPALNQMADVTTTRELAMRNHPPFAIFELLAGLSLVAGMLVGYGTSVNQRRSWFYLIVLAAVLASTEYVIVDMEFPLRGLIRVDAADAALVDLRESLRTPRPR